MQVNQLLCDQGQVSAESSMGYISATYNGKRIYFPVTSNMQRRREQIPEEHRILLEDVYKLCQYPSIKARMDLAAILGQDPNKIRVWFQNRRAKSKNMEAKREKSPTLT